MAEVSSILLYFYLTFSWNSFWGCYTVCDQNRSYALILLNPTLKNHADPDSSSILADLDLSVVLYATRYFP